MYTEEGTRLTGWQSCRLFVFKSLSGLAIILAQLLLLVKLILWGGFCFSAISVEIWAQTHHLPTPSIPKAHAGLTLRDFTRTALWVSLLMGQHCWACKECFTFYEPLGTTHWLHLQAHEVDFLALYIHLHLLWLNLIWNTGMCGWKHCKTPLSHQFSGEGNTWGVHNTFSQCQTAKIAVVLLQLKICTLLQISIDLCNAQQT